MSGKVANKAVNSAEEQIHIVIRQMGEGIKGEAIDSHRYRSREERAFAELHTVGVVVIGHGTLNQSQAFPSILSYRQLGQRCIAIRTSGQTKTNGVRRTNVGLTKTIGDGAECPGIGSNQMSMIHSLYNLIQNNLHTKQVKVLTKTDVDGSCGE
jgi:hypothetical protein